jgi:hypothetical protein
MVPPACRNFGSDFGGPVKVEELLNTLVSANSQAAVDINTV